MKIKGGNGRKNRSTFLKKTSIVGSNNLHETGGFGSNKVLIETGSYDACDLIEQGRISQEQLDEAITQVYKTYRPVCIAADGLPLVDVVGGVSGYAQFLRSQHPREEAAFWGKGREPDNGPYDDKQGSLIWAKSLGWTDNMNIKRML